MKLYTEEQMAKVWKAGQRYWETSGASITFEELLEQEKPIELPTDKEMDKFLFDNSYEYGYGYRDAINWMKQQILNQNK